MEYPLDYGLEPLFCFSLMGVFLSHNLLPVLFGVGDLCEEKDGSRFLTGVETNSILTVDLNETAHSHPDHALRCP